jgi:hypothetical protein
MMQIILICLTIPGGPVNNTGEEFDGRSAVWALLSHLLPGQLG